MRPHGSPEALEQRRRLVVALLRQELSLHEIARRIGCHASSVLRWRNALRAAAASLQGHSKAPRRARGVGPSRASHASSAASRTARATAVPSLRTQCGALVRRNCPTDGRLAGCASCAGVGCG